MEINTNYSPQLSMIESCLKKILNKKLLESEKQLLEGILKTRGNNFKYKEVVKAQFANIHEEQAEKLANNYKVYFGKLRQTFQDYYDKAPYLEGFKIRVTKDNFKRLLDTYIFDNNSSELIQIRICNIFCLVESLERIEIDKTAFENLEIFRIKIEKIIIIFEALLKKIQK